MLWRGLEGPASAILETEVKDAVRTPDFLADSEGLMRLQLLLGPRLRVDGHRGADRDAPAARDPRLDLLRLHARRGREGVAESAVQRRAREDGLSCRCGLRARNCGRIRVVANAPYRAIWL